LIIVRAIHWASYTYDGDDNLVKSVVNGVTTYYTASSYVVETDGETTTVNKTYMAGSTSIAVRTIVGEEDTLNWTLGDHTSAKFGGTLRVIFGDNQRQWHVVFRTALQRLWRNQAEPFYLRCQWSRSTPGVKRREQPDHAPGGRGELRPEL
jgi:hypothetical protein